MKPLLGDPADERLGEATPALFERVYDWPLDSHSLVLDVGGYHGSFTAEMVKRYGCSVVMFEPVSQFMRQANRNLHVFLKTGQVKFEPFGLAGSDSNEYFGMATDSTGLYTSAEEVVAVELKDVAGWLARKGNPPVALLKLNVEGMEYEILERLLESGKIRGMARILVQFHRMLDGFREHRKAIRERLRETHRELWCEPWVWEAWERI